MSARRALPPAARRDTLAEEGSHATVVFKDSTKTLPITCHLSASLSKDSHAFHHGQICRLWSLQSLFKGSTEVRIHLGNLIIMHRRHDRRECPGGLRIKNP